MGSTGARVVRCVDADHAGDAIDMSQRHLPHDEAAPVMTDENRLVDLEMIEQPDQIAGQVLDIVGFDALRPVSGSIAALVRCDEANPGLAQRLDLMPPGKCDFRPAVAKNDGRRVGLWPAS